MTKLPLIGRTAIITGANQGLGLAIAQAFVAAGAHLMICARDADRLAEAERLLASSRATADQRILAVPTDISQPEQVTALVKQTIATIGRLDILVNNAGIYGPKGRIEDIDWAEWKAAFDINLHGSVLMCRAVLPHFRKQHYGKIIQLSGGGATNPMPRLESYATTKAAIVRFCESLAHDVRDDGIDVNAVAPGLLDTRLLDEVIAAGPGQVGPIFHKRMVEAKAKGKAAPLELGANLCVYLASAASDGITGRLLSAQWDRWQTLHERAGELAASDIYTLRRITAKERGKIWDPA